MSSTTPTKITLFDIATTLPDSEPISPFCARVRYVLNYKKLTYTTVWILFKDIQAVYEKHGIKPTSLRADGSPRYTLPAIVDETSNGKAIAMSDSYPIIKYLEETYPDPSRALFPSPSPNSNSAPAIQLIADAYIMDLHVTKVLPFVLEGIHNIITPESRADWKRNNFGDKNLEDIVVKKGSKEYEEAFGKLTDALKVIAGFMEMNGEAKWMLGDNPTFIDFVFLSFLRIPMLANPAVWQAIKEINNGYFAKYMEAGNAYIEWK